MTLTRLRLNEISDGHSLRLEHGILSYFRPGEIVTRLDIADLTCVELRKVRGKIYWYLVDRSNCFAIIPEDCPDIRTIRRYLSQWTGFDYDGLIRFDTTQESTLQLWPFKQLTAA